MEGCKKPVWKFREREWWWRSDRPRVNRGEGGVGFMWRDAVRMERWEASCGDDLRDVLLSSSSPLWSNISTLPARLREYRRTLSNGFSRSWSSEIRLTVLTASSEKHDSAFLKSSSDFWISECSKSLHRIMINGLIDRNPFKSIQSKWNWRVFGNRTGVDKLKGHKLHSGLCLCG